VISRSDTHNSSILSVMRFAIVLVLPVALSWAFAIAPASGAEGAKYEFDPALSLTGDCSESLLDPVPDPGCTSPQGEHPGAFSHPSTVTVDQQGDVYLDNPGSVFENIENARIDVFSPTGKWITSLHVPGARYIAVDAAGMLYVMIEQSIADRVVRYEPSVYKPSAGEIAYMGSPTVVLQEGPEVGFAGHNSLAVDGAGHLYVNLGFGSEVRVYGSAAEGNVPIGQVGKGIVKESGWIAVDNATSEVYVGDMEGGTPNVSQIDVFDSSKPSYPLVRTITGKCAPGGKFVSTEGLLAPAVDEASHTLFVYDGQGSAVGAAAVYEMTENGECIGTIEHHLEYTDPTDIAIANASGYPNQGELYVPSTASPHGHLYAFKPVTAIPPPTVLVTTATGISSKEAVLNATIDPHGAASHYTFEYTPVQAFATNGFANAVVAGGGSVPAGVGPTRVAAPVTGLAAGVSYKVRVSAENECEHGCGSSEAEGEFATYPEFSVVSGCPNEATRLGASTALPDCRAYELVTPSDTGGREPYGLGNNGAGPMFGTPAVAPNGDAASFMIFGGTLPGFSGSGGFDGDVYLSERTSQGWQTSLSGPSGTQATVPLPGGRSPDLEVSAWEVANDPSVGGGELFRENTAATYIRYPDGTFEPVGRGTLGIDWEAKPVLISSDGAHILFRSGVGAGAVQLEPEAPASGTRAIYDRTANNVTHVISLLPGNGTPEPGENATYLGATPDGSGVVFAIGNTLYERLEDLRTVEVAHGAGSTPVFAGISEDARHVVYLEGGNLFTFDVNDGATTQVTTSGDATPVNVSADGQTIYFVSPSVLAGPEAMAGRVPNVEEPQEGGENLYSWGRGEVSYIATLTKRDVVGELSGVSGFQIDGLGLWASTLTEGTYALDPSRTTAAGDVLLFESRADLVGYETNGAAEIYRYDTAARELRCVSCVPTGTPPSGSASLVSVDNGAQSSAPDTRFTSVANLSANGNRAVFQSPDALAVGDNDGVQDVYEWEASGEGTCATPGGCVFLVSSGHSARDSYLYGVSESGSDVFISTSDLLSSADVSEAPAIYDARVDGGFAPLQAQAAECLGEACQPPPVALSDLTPASLTFSGTGNVKIAQGSKLAPQASTRPKKRVKRHRPGAKKKHPPSKHKARKSRCRRRCGSTGGNKAIHSDRQSGGETGVDGAKKVTGMGGAR
jgi:hypothetical protein